MFVSVCETVSGAPGVAGEGTSDPAADSRGPGG